MSINKVCLTSRNAFTVPMNIAKRLNLYSGQQFMVIENEKDGSILFTPYDKNTIDNSKDDNISTKSRQGFSLISNIDEPTNYVKKYYSDCGLIVRSRIRYITKACNKCKGILALNNDKECPLYPQKIKEPKKVEIEEKVEIKVTHIKKKIASKAKEPIRTGDTILAPIQLANDKRCKCCKESFDAGFLIDNKFYCKNCAKKDVINYINTIKKGV